MYPTSELIDLIELAKKNNGIESDNALDVELKVKKQVYRWRGGFNLPGDNVAVRLAQLAGQDPAYVLALMAALKAEKLAQTDAASVWRDLVKQLATVSVLIGIALMPDFGSQPVSARELPPSASVYYGAWRRFLKSLRFTVPCHA